MFKSKLPKIKFPKNTPTVLSLIAIVAVCINGFFLWKMNTRINAVETANILAQKQNTGAKPNLPKKLYTDVKELAPLVERDHLTGNKDARIIIVEYSDMECPYCSKFHETAQKLVDSYNGQVAWVFRHFPIPSRPNAMALALGSECAYDIGGNQAFWDFTNTLYKEFPYSIQSMDKYVLAKGWDSKAFTACVTTKKNEAFINEQSASGTAAGVNATPGNIVWDTKTGEKRLYMGAYPFDTLKAEIDKMLLVK